MTTPSHSHPEDSPGFDAYPKYGATEGQETPEWVRTTPAVGTGTVTAMDAVPWAFKAVFRNWHIWILGALVLGIAYGAFSFFTAPDYAALDDPAALETEMTNNLISSGGMGLVGFVLTPFFLVGMLAQVSKERISLGDFFRNVPYLKVLAVSLLQSLAFGLIMGPLAAALVMLVAATGTPLAAVLAALVGILVMWLLGPLYSLWTWYAADGHGIGESIKLGFAAGKRNYVTLLVFPFLATLVLLVGGMVTLGLGLVILTPAYYLMIAHIYRQASGGQLPA